MANVRSSKQAKKSKTASSLMVRLDEKSKTYLFQAAKLRRISVSDYVRTTIVTQARREVLSARVKIIALTSEEQRAFWNALNETPRLTGAQRRLGATMRGAT